MRAPIVTAARPYATDKSASFVCGCCMQGPTGHRVMAEMAAHLIIKAAFGLIAQPLTQCVPACLFFRLCLLVLFVRVPAVLSCLCSELCDPPVS